MPFISEYYKATAQEAYTECKTSLRKLLRSPVGISTQKLIVHRYPSISCVVSLDTCGIQLSSVVGVRYNIHDAT